MKIFYNDSECGSGKTFAMLKHLTANPGLYIVSLPKVDLIKEHSSTLKSMSGAQAVVVKSIFSEPGKHTVAGEIHETMEHWAKLGISHGVIFISHEALNLADWSRPSIHADQWELFIDEAPCPWAYYNQNHPVTNVDVRQLLSWAPLPESDDKRENKALNKYVQLSLSQKGEDLASSCTDAMREAYGPLLNVVRHGKIAVGNRSFFEPDGSKDSTKLSVFSLTDPHRLSVFRHVTILSANFLHTFAYLLWSGDTVTFTHHPAISSNRSRSVPLSSRTRIFSFGPKNASLNWFKADCKPLDMAGAWITQNLDRPFFYAKNEAVEDSIRGTLGEMVAPIAIGSNRLSDKTAAVWFVALKAEPLEYATIRSVFGISRDQFDRAREHEALYQFALRSNLRDFDSTTQVDLYVISDRQAKYLCDVLGVTNFEQVGVNLPQSEKPATDAAPIGRPPKHKTAEERLEAQRKSKRESAQRTRAQQGGNQQQQKAA